MKWTKMLKTLVNMLAILETAVFPNAVFRYCSVSLLQCTWLESALMKCNWLWYTALNLTATDTNSQENMSTNFLMNQSINKSITWMSGRVDCTPKNLAKSTLDKRCMYFGCYYQICFFTCHLWIGMTCKKYLTSKCSQCSLHDIMRTKVAWLVQTNID